MKPRAFQVIHRMVPLALAGSLIVALGLGQGCSPRPRGHFQTASAVDPVRLSTYYLSPGDEIRISVYGYDQLDRTVRVPPDSRIFYPLVGEVDVTGMSIPDLRKVLTQGLQSAEDQRIASGDLLEVSVYRHKDLDANVIVPSSGRVTLPLAGEVAVAGLTIGEANAAIASALSKFLVRPSVMVVIREAALPGRIENPQVSVEVLRFGGQKILVLGEVATPGVYLNEGGARLLDVLALAGGPTIDAKLKTVALLRPATATTPAESMVVNLKSALETGDYSQNLPVQRGDVVYVPRTVVSDVAQFFQYLYLIVRPIVQVETGIWLGQNIEKGPRGQRTGGIVFSN